MEGGAFWGAGGLGMVTGAWLYLVVEQGAGNGESWRGDSNP